MDTQLQEERPTWRADQFLIGLGVLLLVEVGAGIFLHLSYSPTAAAAYSSVRDMPPYARALHYWSSAVLILGSIVSLAWMTLKGRFKTEPASWYAGLLLFLVSFGGQVTGNLAPFDRHGVQTAVVEAGIARGVPLGGAVAAQTMLGGEQFSDATLPRWYTSHAYAIGILSLIALGLLLTRRHKRSPSISWFWPTAAVLVLAALVAAPLGEQATASDYASFDAQVSWYTWPMHGALNLFNRLSPSLGWIGTAVLPTLLIALLVLAPRLPTKLVKGGTAAIAAIFLVAAIAFGGGFAPLTGNRDPVAQKASSTSSARKADPALFARGQELFASAGCAGCHGANGRKGDSGPALLNIAARRGYDPAWYMKFIRDPHSVKPSSTMPAFPNLKEDELKALAEFLIYQR